MEENMSEAPFMQMDDSMEFLINRCDKCFKNIAQCSGQEIANALNYRDELQIALEGNYDIISAHLERILVIDDILRKGHRWFKDKLDRNFVEGMKKTYPASHWWWYI